jgi:hypothetical protein
MYHTKKKKRVKICDHYKINCSCQRLGTFKKQLQKQLLGSVCLSLCPPICMEQLHSNWMDFHNILHLGFMQKFVNIPALLKIR